MATTDKKKYWLSADEERRLCEMWLAEPLVNPETGHSIDRNGPTYLSFKERCEKIGLASRPVATWNLTYSKCQEWRSNPTINPDTGRKISSTGPTYKWLEKQCSVINEKEVSLQGDYYKPDAYGFSPCVKEQSIYYIIRGYDGRKVWGPLNKPAKRVVLKYYTDTWDYRNGHYRPVFIHG